MLMSASAHRASDSRRSALGQRRRARVTIGDGRPTIAQERLLPPERHIERGPMSVGASRISNASTFLIYSVSA